MKLIPILFSTPMVEAILDGRKTMTRRILKPQPHESITDIKFGYSALTPDGTIELRGYFDVDGQKRYGSKFFKCPYGQPRDLLWVKENYYQYGHWVANGLTKTGKIKYKFVPQDGDIIFNATITARGVEFNLDVKPNSYRSFAWYKRLARFMPLKYARTFLKVKSIRVERLHEISHGDACEEGIKYYNIDKDSFEGGELVADYENYTWKDDPTYEDFHFPTFANPIDSFRTLWQSINGEASWKENPWVWVVSFEKTEKP